jgi:hypothetical protein
MTVAHPQESLRRWTAERALSGQSLSAWWQDDWTEARRRAISTSGSGSGPDGRYFEVQARGVAVWIGRRYEGGPPQLTEHDFEKRVRQPDVLMPWSEVRAIVLKGATPERRERYELAQRAYVEIVGTSPPTPWVPTAARIEAGLPSDDGWYFDDPANQAHWDHSTSVIGELQSASQAIIEAGCHREVEYEQEALFETAALSNDFGLGD